jgi:hypothetical protein
MTRTWRICPTPVECWPTAVSARSRATCRTRGPLPSPPDFGRLVEALGRSEPEKLAAFWNRPPAAGDLPHVATLQALLDEAAAELARLEDDPRTA